MFGIGLSELIIVGVLALIFIGPNELPAVAAKIARFINELRRSADSFKEEFNVKKVIVSKVTKESEDQSIVKNHPPTEGPTDDKS
ncbi:MAG TPA: hypothetical protein PLJ21_08365 [Pseudobdellovibrionaceae bacterium]|nr:hypothetical protein [Pseudobdellovibrionaceae bacterium]